MDGAGAVGAVRAPQGGRGAQLAPAALAAWGAGPARHRREEVGAGTGLCCQIICGQRVQEHLLEVNLME